MSIFSQRLVAFSRPVRGNSRNGTGGVCRMHFLERAAHIAHSVAEDKSVVSSSFIVIPHAHSHPVSLMSLLNVKFTPFRGLLQNQRLTTALCCGEYANIIRCFWCFTLLMNLHDFVTRVITDCRTLFDCLTKDASVLEDRAAALTVTSLRQRCSAGVGRDPKRSGLIGYRHECSWWTDWQNHLLESSWENALTAGTAQLHEQSAKVLKRKQLTGSPREVRDVCGPNGSWAERLVAVKKQHRSPAQDPSPSTISQLDDTQLLTALSQSTCYFLTGLWRRVHMSYPASTQISQ